MGLSVDINRVINYLILLLIFIIPLSYKLRDIIYGLIIILWIMEGNFKYKWEVLKKNFDIVIGVYLILFILRFLSNLWSDSLYNGSYRGHGNSIIYCLSYDFFYLLIIPIILTSFKREYIKYAVSSFILGMFISEITSYGIIFHLWTTKYGTPDNPTPFLRNHSFYSLFLAITIFWLFKIFLEEKDRLKKVLYFLFILTATTNLFFNSGRTGQVIFIILLLFSLIYFFRFSLKTIFIFFIFTFLSVGIYYKISPNFERKVHQTLNALCEVKKGRFNTSAGGRVLAYFVVKDIVIKHPFGVGVGSSRKYLDKEVEKYGKVNSKYFKRNLPHTHNQFLQYLLEIGFLGFFIYIIFWFFLFKNIKYSIYSYYFYIFFIAYFLALNVETIIRNKYAFLLFNIFLALFILDYKRVKNSL